MDKNLSLRNKENKELLDYLKVVYNEINNILVSNMPINEKYNEIDKCLSKILNMCLICGYKRLYNDVNHVYTLFKQLFKEVNTISDMKIIISNIDKALKIPKTKSITYNYLK